jgi:hypothetical protein
VLLVAVLLAASASAGVEPALGAWTKVAVWEMNEDAGATTMLDSSASNLSGTIGQLVEPGFPLEGVNSAYSWPAGNLDVENPERLVIVPRKALNPRRDAFAVTIRFRTAALEQHIIQKGQASTDGGMWKIDTVDGRVFCLFKGSAGRATVGSRQTQTVSDDNWHTVRCIRRSRSVTIVVDGGLPRKQAGRTGRIANDVPLTIGGKWSCNPPQVLCQYYVGLIDRAVVRRIRR